MREVDGVRGAGTAWLLRFSIVASLASVSGCSAGGEQSGAQGAAGSAAGTGPAASAGSGGSAAGAAGARAPVPGMSAMAAGAPAQSPPMQAAGGGVGGSLAGGNAGGGGVGGGGGGGGAAGAPAAGSAGGAAGSGGSAGGAAGAAAMPGEMDFTSVCAGGKVGMDSDTFRADPLNVSREYAAVKYQASAEHEILTFRMTMKVPKTPTARQTLFIWPGLQNRLGAPDPGRIGNGVLQPVLTWGPSCAPESPDDGFAGWWMAGMYVNVTTGAAGPTGCAGGDFVTTEVGDLLDVDMSVKGNDWIQTITNRSSKKTVDFTIDLEGQVQNIAMWVIEVPSGETIRPPEDVVFTQNVLTFSKPVTSCQPSQAGSVDFFSAPTLSPDGLHCCFDEIILRAER